jgi:cell wall-associated NlpC family hydrolase
MVLQQAAKYAHAAATSVGNGDCNAIQAANAVILPALATPAADVACHMRGVATGPELTELPDGTTRAIGGFDCSGLTKAAYAAAGIQIPRKAQWQYDAGPRVPAGQPILPGDLVFFGTGPNAVTHVGIAVSSSHMINAPHRGAVVRIEPIWRSNLVGVTRLAAVRPDVG